MLRMPKPLKWSLAFLTLAIIMCLGFVLYRLHLGQLNQELITAAEANDLERVRKLLDSGANPAVGKNMIRGSSNWLIDLQVKLGFYRADQSLLDIAAARRHWDVVDLLIERGAAADPAKARLAFHSACWNGRETTVNLVLDRGISVEVPDYDGRTALVLAFQHHQYPIVKVLLERGALVQPLLNSYKSINLGGVPASPLEVLGIGSFRDGDEEMLRLLIEKGLPVDTPLHEGRTPLIAAAIANKSELAKFLLDRNADVNAKDDKGHTALRYAVSRNNTALADHLRQTGGKDE